MPNNNNVHFIQTNSGNYRSSNHPPLYCKICGVRMMFILTGKLAQKYLCGMCGYTVDPNESDNDDGDNEESDDDNEEFYSKHKDVLRSVDDDNDIVGEKSYNSYNSMIVQSNSDDNNSRPVSRTEERQPRRTRQRVQQQYQQLGDDWAYHESVLLLSLLLHQYY
jgi:hypothetical protein